ncbi:DUF3846 domain-containing protein [bacterium]|nr:DUF3846 domain-containing protein [bacterium]
MSDIQDPNQSILITPEGEVSAVDPEGETWSLSELQAHVGGYIEVYPLPHKRGEPKRILVLNEEGLLHGLPKNWMVSALLGEGANIVGTVVVCPSRMVR